jgi:hypothetical protein
MWHVTSLSTAHRDLITELCQRARAFDDPSDFGMRLLFGLADVLAKNGDVEGLEAAGDLLTQYLAAVPPSVPDRLRLAVRITRRFYELASECETPRHTPVLIKAAGLSGLLSRLGPQNVDPAAKAEREKEAKQFFEAAIYTFIEHTVGKDRPLFEQVQWKLSALARLLPQLPGVRRHQPHLAAALAREMVAIYPHFEAVAQPKPLPIERADLGRVEVDCLLARAEWDLRVGLTGWALEALSAAAFVAVYVAGETARGRELAARALKVGDRLLSETAGPGAPESQNVLVDLYNLARLTADEHELERRLEARVRATRAEGNAREQAGDWERAADAFAHLGYLYFVSSQYTHGERLALLTVYFFERSLACRERAPSAPADPSEQQLDPVYRRYEAEGFMAGASAALSEGDAVGRFLRAASQTHEKAAELTFQHVGLSEFYKSAGNHFEAHRHLRRAVTARDWQTAARHVFRAAEPFRRSFEMFQSVYPIYCELLIRTVRDRERPVPPAFGTELARLGHPDPDRLLAATDRCRLAFGRSEDEFGAGIGELLAALPFINPQG